MKTKIQKWFNNITSNHFVNPSLEKNVNIDKDQVTLSEENVNIGNNQASLSEVATDEIIICPNCSIKNRIPVGKSISQAKCGKCNRSLDQVKKEAPFAESESLRDKLKRVAKEQEQRIAKEQAKWEARQASEKRAEQAEREARQASKEQAERATREKEIAKQELLDRNQDLIMKFLEIAERKVSIIDDYGDENWEVLPGEIRSCPFLLLK